MTMCVLSRRRVVGTTTEENWNTGRATPTDTALGNVCVMMVCCGVATMDRARRRRRAVIITEKKSNTARNLRMNVTIVVA